MKKKEYKKRIEKEKKAMREFNLNNENTNIKSVLIIRICVIAFVFDLNFCESYEIVKSSNYINLLIDKFNYKNDLTCDRMEYIRKIVNNYVDKKIKVKRKQ